MIKKIVTGEQLQGIHADSWNAFADAAEFVQGLQTPAATPGPLRRAPLRVQLNADREAFDVVSLTEPMATIEDTEEAPFRGPPVLKGTAPTSAKKIAIVQRGGISAQVVPAVAVGVTWARVDVVDEDHKTAGASPGDASKLISGRGGATILWKESGTGTKWAVVLLGESANSFSGVTETVQLLSTIPARVGDIAGYSEAARIVALCTFNHVGLPEVTINDRVYDFTDASLGEYVEPDPPAPVVVYNKSKSPIYVPSGEKVFWDANQVSPFEYELIAPPELRTISGYSTASDMSLGIDAADGGNPEWQADGSCPEE